MKIAHIADTHIKNLKYHEDYRACFEQMYEILREQEVDYIVHCGDIAHTKTQISPEFVEMASDFFSNLSKIATTFVILGNHDGNLKNSSRQDAITPIVQALDSPYIQTAKELWRDITCLRQCRLECLVGFRPRQLGSAYRSRQD